MVEAARHALLRERLTPTVFPECANLRVLTAPEPIAVWEASERASGQREAPPFWAHVWPGSRVLAQWLTAFPERVRGKRVLDFASGGGLSALAAARAGAREVTATEIDAWARTCIGENARLNTVTLDVRGDVLHLDEGWDVVLVGDVFYEAVLAEQVMSWLTQLHARGAEVFIGDPGRSFLPQARLRRIHTGALQPVLAWDSVVDRPPSVWELLP